MRCHDDVRMLTHTHRSPKLSPWWWSEVTQKCAYMQISVAQNEKILEMLCSPGLISWVLVHRDRSVGFSTYIKLGIPHHVAKTARLYLLWKPRYAYPENFSIYRLYGLLYRKMVNISKTVSPKAKVCISDVYKHILVKTPSIYLVTQMRYSLFLLKFTVFYEKKPLHPQNLF